MLQNICAFLVSLTLICVYNAIKFYNELMLSTVEVYNKLTYRMLTAKLKPT